jgi:tetratricopeptide (TPR) repeat protein
MIRFTHLFFLLLLLMAAPLLAQSKAPPAPQSDQAAQIKAQDAKIEALTKSVGEARYEKNIAEIKAEILQSQTSWFEILTSAMIGLFGVLITAVVIYFVFKFDSDARTKIEQAVKASERLTNDAVQKLTAETDLALASAKQLLEEAKAAVADIHVERETARELTKGMSPGEAPSDPATQEKIADLARMAKLKPRKERTIDDYRALVTDAFIQKDWDAMERRASAMAYFFEGEADDESMAFALFNKAYALGELKRHIDAVAIFDDLVVRYGNHDMAVIQERVCAALYNKGIDLGKLDRSEDAIAAYDEVLARFGAIQNPALQTTIVSALYNKGVRLGKLNRSEDAIAIYDQVVMRFGDVESDVLQERVAKALFNKGVRLGEQKRRDDAIATYDAVAVRFDNTKNPAIKEHLFNAIFNKACALAAMGKGNECIKALTLWTERRGGVDCEAIKSESDFDKVRNRKAFKAYLAAHGCA